MSAAASSAVLVALIGVLATPGAPREQRASSARIPPISSGSDAATIASIETLFEGLKSINVAPDSVLMCRYALIDGDIVFTSGSKRMMIRLRNGTASINGEAVAKDGVSLYETLNEVLSNLSRATQPHDVRASQLANRRTVIDFAGDRDFVRLEGDPNGTSDGRPAYQLNLIQRSNSLFGSPP